MNGGNEDITKPSSKKISNIGGGIEADDAEIESTEINTDLWDHNKAVAADSDTMFETIEYDSELEKKKTPEEIKEEESNEIVNLFEKKYKSKSSNKVKKERPSFFEELYAKEHPEEVAKAAKLAEAKAEKAAKLAEAKAEKAPSSHTKV